MALRSDARGLCSGTDVLRATPRSHLSETVSLPFWAAAGLVLLAAVALLDRALVPGVRWFLRRRVNRAIDEINRRLRLRIRPFKLTRRAVLIDRLTFDPRVVEAAEAHAAASGEPREVAMARVASYAREIVPSFSTYAYFRLGYSVARATARTLYRVRVGFADDAGLSRVDPDASVVFVMNHRSNMDYVLVSYLAAEKTALSYAVGEWARIWPLQSLIRSMGAYFVRRDSGDPLYRRVLERYVQMAADAGVVQAMFPEGGLTRDGALRPPRLGLLDYMLRDYDPARRDLVFVPVGINYDRVLEDRTQIGGAAGQRGSKADTALRAARFTLRNAWQWMGGRWYRFGYACVNFGTPISMRAWLSERGGDLRGLSREERSRRVLELGTELIGAVGQVIPALPVPLVAFVLLDSEEPLPSIEIHRRTQALARRLQAAGGHVYVPRTDEEYATAVGLRALSLRRLIEERDGGFAPVPAEVPVLQYYANSIRHLLPDEV
ncbi:MAG: 1-acyl-sn-glycerol-3-phosphate acyltransferase [Deltaproteobacteria bacterium]